MRERVIWSGVIFFVSLLFWFTLPEPASCAPTCMNVCVNSGQCSFPCQCLGGTCG